MVSKLLIRGMLVGLAAALAAFAVAKLLGESQVGHAIVFEDARSAASGLPADPQLVSRTVQSTLGLATGLLAFSVAIGGMFALTYACV
jgi:putative cobalt transporter subunit CbtA